MLRYRAKHDAERTHLLITEDVEGQERSVTLTFGELYAAAQRCAAELARRGVSAGGRVALMLPTSRAFFISYAGILLAGAIPVPIYPPFRATGLRNTLHGRLAFSKRGSVLAAHFSARRSGRTSGAARVRSLTAVVDAEKLIEAADKARRPRREHCPRTSQDAERDILTTSHCCNIRRDLPAT